MLGVQGHTLAVGLWVLDRRHRVFCGSMMADFLSWVAYIRIDGMHREQKFPFLAAYKWIDGMLWERKFTFLGSIM